ncbi:helix-turn-helix domain-containing protein [Patescibacteria group bacterium]|nr:helix-turn-helix domain-containing protein [Patescibacteria group bacterium]
MATQMKFTISRKEAADLLDVSTRTIDRHIRQKKLTARKKGGNILLNEEELNNFKVSRFQNMHGASPEVSGRAHRHVDGVSKRQTTIIDGDTGKIEEAIKMEETAAAKGEIAPVNEREKVFEELYDLSRREIREYNNKLEAANYRLGQIETQLKHSVPLLEYQEQSEALRETETVIQKKMQQKDEAVDALQSELRSERLNKNVYIGLLFGLLALQPLLWLLLQG